MSDYKDYGYYDASHSHIHSVLIPPILQLLNNSRPACILDIRCGNGALAAKLIDSGFNVYGIDASASGIEIANRAHPGRFFVQDVSSKELPAPIQHLPFDMVISTEVIEHLYRPQDLIDLALTAFRHHQGKGHIILSTPYHGYWKNLALAITGKMDDHFTTLWEGGHIKFWSRKSITELLARTGFKVTDFKGTGRLPYLWKSMVVHASRS